MNNEADEAAAGNIESLAFVDGAIRMDKDKFLEMTRRVNALIDYLQRSKANPVTIYYITRALDGYASDKLKAFGRSVESSVPEDSTITAESLKEAVDRLFAIAIEDAAKMTAEEQQALVEQQLARKRQTEIGYV
ncbi:MAG: hypothetical protein GX307_01580 [Euryarchaeota archaeon]|nr:hypothetical protein [Euryarchaeota archaeon]